MSQCWISGFLEKVLKCSFGNISTIKAYVAYDSLFLEQDRGPEWCQQENKFYFSIVLLFNPIKAFLLLLLFFSSQNVWKTIREEKKKKSIVEMQAKQ